MSQMSLDANNSSSEVPVPSLPKKRKVQSAMKDRSSGRAKQAEQNAIQTSN